MLNGLKNELKRPSTVFGILFAIIGIAAGALTSFYFYYKGIIYGQVIFYVE
jgi:hypothetical protein